MALTALRNTERERDFRHRWIRWSTILCCLAAAAGCQTVQLNHGLRTKGSDILMDGGNLGRQRFSDEDIKPPFEEAWVYNAAAAFGPGSPLFFSNAVLVGNRNGELHAVELKSGKNLGTRNLGESLEGPLLIHDGMIYVTNAWGKYTLTAYDLSEGERMWRARGASFESAPVIDSGYVIAVDVEGTLRAFEPVSGVEAWKVSLGEKVSGQTSPLILSGGRLFVATDTGSAFMIETAHGGIIWTVTLGAPIYASPAATGEVLLIPTTRGKFIALSAQDGSLIWEFDTGNREVRFTSPATDGRSAYVGSSEGTVYELAVSSGTVLWRFDGPDAVVAPPLLTRDYLFIGTMGRMLYAFERASHDLVWEKLLKGRIKSAMAARDAYLVVLTEPRYVYSFRTESSDAGTL